MKKQLTRGENWLFAAPFLFLVVGLIYWVWQKNAPLTLPLPDSVVETKLAFSPDSKRLVAIYSKPRNQQYAGRIFDAESGEFRSELQKPTLKSSLFDFEQPFWSPDGRSIFAGVNIFSSFAVSVATLSHEIAIWNVDGGSIKAGYAYQGEGLLANHQLKFSPDGKTIEGVGVPPIRFEAVTGKRLNRPAAGIDQAEAVLNEKLGLMAGSNDVKANVRVVDFKTRRLIWTVAANRPYDFRWFGDVLSVNDTTITEGGQLQVTNKLILWDGKTRVQLPSPPIMTNAEIEHYVFNSDGRTIAYSNSHWTKNGADSELVVWDYRANRVVWRYKLSDGQTFDALQPSPDGRWLFAFQSGTSRFQSSVMVFDRNGNMRWQRPTTGQTAIWSSDSKKLAIFLSEWDRLSSLSIRNRIEIHRFDDE